MPKDKNKEEESEEDDVLKELAEGLKLGEEPNEEDEDINLRDIDFSQFTPSLEIPKETSVPVLERIAGSQARPVFVGGISQAPQATPENGKESDEFKYVPGQNAEDEPKYIESDARISREPEKVDFARLGREQTEAFPQTNQQAFFDQASEQRNFQSQNIERAGGAERLNVERAGRRDVFEGEEAKYEKYKPKLPKSG